MLHCEIEVPGMATPVHCINVHLGLTERGRKRQLAMIAARVRAMVPDNAPLILAGDFNDWQLRVGRYFEDELGGRGIRNPPRQSGAQLPVHPPMFQLDRIYVRRFNVQARTSTPATLASHFRPRRPDRQAQPGLMTARNRLRKFFFRGTEPVPGNHVRLLQSGAEFIPGTDRGDRRRARRSPSRNLYCQRRPDRRSGARRADARSPARGAGALVDRRRRLARIAGRLAGCAQNGGRQCAALSSADGPGLAFQSHSCGGCTASWR